MTKPAHKILFVSHSAGDGGAEQSLSELVQALPRDRFDVGIVLPEQGPLSDRLDAIGIPYKIIPFVRMKRRPLMNGLTGFVRNCLDLVPQLVSLVRPNNVALIHANSNTAQLFAGMAARRCGIPSIWHCRDLAPMGLERLFVRKSATRVLAISNAVRSHMIASGIPETRISLLQNGIDLERFSEEKDRGAFRKERDLSPYCSLTVMAGQLVPWKRHDLFLSMAASVVARVPDARFVIAGDDARGDHPGYLQSLQENAKRLGIHERVIFAGHLADIRPLLRDADCMVHPAAREPFGRIVVEAMAMGRPVVAVNDAGPADIIRHGKDGFLVPAGNAEAMAQAVVSLRQDPALSARMGVAARQRSLAFDIRKTAEALVAIYDSILGTPVT